MSTLDLSPVKSARKERKRVGRGIGSGHGKTCGKGHKGQNSRSGASVPLWFEGGQTPLYRRVPKRGFTNHFAREWNILNVDDLVRAFHKISSHDKIDVNLLRSEGIISKKKAPLKLLGRKSGKIKLDDLKGKTIVLNGCSESARSLVEKSGGKIETLDMKDMNSDEGKEIKDNKHSKEAKAAQEAKSEKEPSEETKNEGATPPKPDPA